VKTRIAISISIALALCSPLANAQSPTSNRKAKAIKLAPTASGPQLPVTGAGTLGRLTK